VRYPRGDAQGVVLERELREIPIGTWEILRNGGDLTIVASGNTVYPCLAAAQILHENHIDCTVVNGRFIKPMDRELLIDVANRTKKILTVEENTVIGGFGSGILEVLSEEGIVVPVKRIGIPDMFITHGTQKTLRKRIGIDTEGIVRKVLEWLKRE